MFNPAEALRDNPALFACYILFVYFRGRNAVRIEREMRGLGFTTFHRRNLYPRGSQPGWIARFDWARILTAETQRRGDIFKQDGQDRQDPSPKPEDEYPVHPVHPVKDPSQRLGVSAVEKPDFHTWLKRVAPNMTWDWKHQQVIIKQLEKVTTGDCKRLMIFLPPRHGKTELVSVRYTAWRMQQDPSMNVILGSYNQRLADKMSRKIRTAICDSYAFTAETQRRRETSQPMSVPPAVAGGCSQPVDPLSESEIRPQMDTDNHRSENIRDHQCSSVAENSPRLGVSAVENDANPFPFSRPRPKNAVSEWETAMGGSFRAVGSGSGVTGFGANLLVIDDPVKNRAQAESETFRNRIWDWYKDDLYTRLEPDGSIVLIQTRWHEDDLAGRLLRDDLDNWTVINLPALSEASSTADTSFKQDAQDIQDSEGGNPAGREGVTLEPDPCGVIENLDQQEEHPAHPVHPVNKLSSTADTELKQDVEGGNTSSSECAPHPPTSKKEPDTLDDQEKHPAHPVHPVKTSRFEWRELPNIALCPERFPIEALEQQRRQLGTYSFSALYQQRPTPAGGQIFKREWFKNYLDFAPPGLKWKRGYDLAVSTSTESDYTASFRCAFDNKTGNLYISGGFRRRIEFPEQRRYIIDRMLNERDTEHGVELALHGQALLQDLRRNPAIRGRSLRGVKVSTDKLTRALTWSPLAEEGKVIFVRDSSHTAEPQRRRDLFRQDAQDKQDGISDTEISPHIKKHPAHPVHPVNSSSPRPSVSAVNHTDWISDLLDELSAFPNGTHDDQIDAISLAVHMAAKREFISRGYLVK